MARNSGARKDEKRKRGRPPLKASGAKRSSFNTRLTPQLKERLVAEAAEVGRSLSEEIETRLERSFQIEEAVEQALRVVNEEKYKAFGDEARYRVMQFLASNWNLIEQKFGRKASEDIPTALVVSGVFKEFINQYGPEGTGDVEGIFERGWFENIGREFMEASLDKVRQQVEQRRKHKGSAAKRSPTKRSDKSEGES